MKDKASQIFQKVKDAFSNNDIDALQSILNDLKSGVIFGNLNYDSQSDISLEEILINLKQKIILFYDKINSLKNDKRYSLILNSNALDEHFEQEEILLKNRKEMLTKN